jgi:hypothetical protein
VVITAERLAELREFEGEYDLQRIRCIYEGTYEEVDAFAFIKESFEFLAHPTEQYLTAIYHHLDEVGLHSAIEIVGIEGDDRHVINAGWKPPPPLEQTLPAFFFVSVNVRLCTLGEVSWVIPKIVNEMVEKLQDRYNQHE